jgi:hypothetical protein
VTAFVLAVTALGMTAEPTRAADPSLGIDASWSVTRPDGTPRTDGAIAPGDDLELAFEAADGTPATVCRFVLMTVGSEMRSPGHVVDGACRMSVRLPDPPDVPYRHRYAPADWPGMDLCIAVSGDFADGEARHLMVADRLQPGNGPCGYPPFEEDRYLDFDFDVDGATERPFTSDPEIVSWDWRDWGTDMEPMQFGTTFRFVPPTWLPNCTIMLNGEWGTSLRSHPTDGCGEWSVRLPGVLPSTLVLPQGYAAWHVELPVMYLIDGAWQTTVSGMSVPIVPSDGVFESNLPAIWPTDLATTRFVTAGERWRPSYQVSGMTADVCHLETNAPATPDGPGARNDYEVQPDEQGVCTFDADPLALGEYRQAYVYALTADDPTNNAVVFGASIEGIAPLEPPVIDPPTPEAGGETGIVVEPGAGQGLVVDLEVTPTTTASGLASVTAGAPACTDQAISPDVGTGGAIPTLEALCGLAPGSYVATATMTDVAGVRSTATRTFTVQAPAPTVASRSPAPSATKVARDVRPTVTFDQAVTGVTGSTFRLRDMVTGSYLSATVTYDAGTRKATLKPASLLRTGRTYRLGLSSSIKGASSGRALASTTWTFTTTTDGTAPTIVGRVPARDATGVSRTANVAVRFSEPVRNVTGSSVQLRDTVTGSYVAAVVTYDPTTYRATLNPTTTLRSNRRYQAIVRSTISDRAGNRVATTSWYFRTRS